MTSILQDKFRFYIGGILVALGAALIIQPSARADESNIYKATKIAVEADAQDAVAAKNEAMAIAERDAFDIVVRRLVPVTYFSKLPKLESDDIAEMIDGVAVRSESNSRTRYLATLDYSFSPEAVRNMLQEQNLPFVEDRAPQLVIVPLSFAEDGSVDTGLSPWRKTWGSLDLINALTPAKLGQAKPDITPELVESLMTQNPQAVSALSKAYGAGNIIFAIATFSNDSSQMQLNIAGTDSVGSVKLNRKFGIVSTPEETMHDAAALTLGILEGRWKSTKVTGGPMASLNAPAETALVTVEFSGFREWQKIRERLNKIPGMKELNVSSLSARGAEVTFTYPGGAEGLSTKLADQALMLENVEGAWIMRSF